MTNREGALAHFEQDLDAWIAQLKATTTADNSLWNEASDLKTRAWNLRGRDPRMNRLYEKLDSALNVLAGQSSQRERFLKEIRAIKNSG